VPRVVGAEVGPLSGVVRRLRVGRDLDARGAARGLEHLATAKREKLFRRHRRAKVVLETIAPRSGARPAADKALAERARDAEELEIWAKASGGERPRPPRAEASRARKPRPRPKRSPRKAAAEAKAVADTKAVEARRPRTKIAAIASRR